MVTSRLPVLAVIVLIVLGSGPAVITATSTTSSGVTVELRPTTQTLAPNTTTTAEIVVTGVDGKISAVNFTVTVNNTAVANISGFTFGDADATTAIQRSSDGSELRVSAFGASFSGDSITLGTVTFATNTSGTANLSLSVAELANTMGHAYNLSHVEAGTLTVTDPHAPTVRVSPDTTTTTVDSTTTVSITAANVEQGVGAYEFTVDVSNASVATIAAVDLAGYSGLTNVTITENNTSATVIAALGELTGPNATLATVTLTPNTEGNATISLTLAELTAPDATLYEGVSVADATIVVEPAPGVPPIGNSVNPPTDPDGDGAYEDVNGDGRVSVLDVQTLFVNWRSTTVRQHGAAFDYSGDGEFSISDIQVLFRQIFFG